MQRFPNLNLTTLLENAHIGIVIHRLDTSVEYANPTALDLLRLSYEQIIGKDAFDPQWSFLDEAGNATLAGKQQTRSPRWQYCTAVDFAAHCGV